MPTEPTVTSPPPEQQQSSGETQQANDTSYELTNYRLQTQLGQEELATAYLASHLTLDRSVQVHILRRTDWVSVSRFQLAARLAARLNHPNLLPVIDAGHDENFGDYMVTPLIEAHLLSDLLRDHGPFDPMNVFRIANQIGAALDYLHSHNIIHRDVQPGNIFVTPEGAAYLANLSLAASPDTPDLSSVDEADYLTPYSAPEQRLDQNDSSTTLDIYSLGAVIYHMFSGDVPASPGTELMPLAMHDQSLSEVDGVVQRMMYVNPESRYTSVNEATAALRRALRFYVDQSTEDMEESEWEPIAEWLENPIETVLGDMLDAEFIAKSHARADTLHRPETIRRMLNRWSRKGFFRRPALGHLIQIEQIVSYNIYSYELRTQYETRKPLPPRQKPQQSSEDRTSLLPMLPLWEVSVPDRPPFTEVPPEEHMWPNSKRVEPCFECGGRGKVACSECKGSGEIEKKRQPDPEADPPQSKTVREMCPKCHGYGEETCTVCKGCCNIVEEQMFLWSRQGYIWKNSDDQEGLPHLALQQRTEPVFTASINLYEDRWHSVAPLAELLREAVAHAGNDSRILAAELSISGVPISEVDYRFNEKSAPQRLYIIGFDTEIVGTWSLLNPERVALLVVGIVLVLMVVGGLVMLL